MRILNFGFGKNESDILSYNAIRFLRSGLTKRGKLFLFVEYEYSPLSDRGGTLDSRIYQRDSFGGA